MCRALSTRKNSHREGWCTRAGHPSNRGADALQLARHVVSDDTVASIAPSNLTVPDPTTTGSTRFAPGRARCRTPRTARAPSRHRSSTGCSRSRLPDLPIGRRCRARQGPRGRDSDRPRRRAVASPPSTLTRRWRSRPAQRVILRCRVQPDAPVVHRKSKNRLRSDGQPLTWKHDDNVPGKTPLYPLDPQ